MSFGEKLKARREELGMTQAELGKLWELRGPLSETMKIS